MKKLMILAAILVMALQGFAQKKVTVTDTLKVKDALQLSAGAKVNEFSIDGTMGGNSDSAVPTEKAVKAYADTKLAIEVDGSVSNELGEYTASGTAPSSPKQGDLWHKTGTDSLFVRDGGSWVFAAIRAATGGSGSDDQTATEVVSTPGGNITAADVQNALLQLDSLKSGKLGSNIITFVRGDTREWRTDTCTNAACRGLVLLAAITGTNQDAIIMLPADTLEVSTSVELKGGQGLIGYSKTQTCLRGNGCHALKFAGAAYRLSVSNMSVETVRSLSGPHYWHGFYFQDKTSGFATGNVQISNVHIREADSCGIYVGKRWQSIFLNNVTFTDAGDIGGYGLLSKAEDVFGTISGRYVKILLDTASTRNRINAHLSYSEKDLTPPINLGTENSINTPEAVNMLIDSIGGQVHLRQKDFKGGTKIRAYYPFDRANYVNGVIFDQSGNLANGYSNSSTSPSIVSTPFGDGFHFDGVDDFLAFSSTNGYTDGKFYCSFMMYADNTTTGTLVYQGSQFVYRYNSAGSTFQTFQTSGSSSRTVSLAEKKWYHIGVVLNGTTYEVWVNGVLSQTSNTTAGVKSGTPGRIYIGSQNGTTSFFKGTISQLLFVDGWYKGIEKEYFTNSVLKKPLQFDIPKLPELLPEKIVAYYPLVSTSGTAYDYSSNALNGTITGTLTNVVTPFGGNGEDFNGSSNKITIADSPLFDMQNFYISVLASWDVNASRRIAYKQGTLELSFKTDGIDASVWVGGVEKKAEFTVSQNTLYHVGIGVKSNIIYLTINGQIVDTTAFVGNIDTSANAFIIGAQNSTSYWDGLMSQFLILNDFSAEIAKQVYRNIVLNRPFLQQRAISESVTNEGALSVGAATSNSSQIATNTSGDGGVILKVLTNNLLTESADSIKLAFASGSWSGAAAISNVTRTDTLLNGGVAYGHFTRMGEIVSFSVRWEVALNGDTTSNVVYVPLPYASNFTAGQSDVVGTADMAAQGVYGGLPLKVTRALLFADDSSDRIAVTYTANKQGATYPANRTYVSASGYYLIK